MTRYYAGPWVWDDSDSSPSPHYRAPAGTVAVVDLRSLPLQSVGQHASGTGHGFFSGPDDMQLPASDYTLLGTGHLRDLQIGGAVRSAWESLYGVRVPGDAGKLIDCLSYTLTDGADPEGLSGPKPLVPCVGPPVGECTINLAGHSVVYSSTVDVIRGQSRHARSLRHMMQRELENLADNDPDPDLWRRVAGFQKKKYGQAWDDDTEDWMLTAKLRGKGKGKNGRTFANEPKTTANEGWSGSDGVITSGRDLAWTYFATSGGMTVVSNQLHCNAASTWSLARAANAMSGSDTYAKNKYISVTGGASQGFASLTRKDNNDATVTCYKTSQYISTVYMSKWVTGSLTHLTSTSNSIAANDIIKMESNGSAQKSYVNATEKLSITDTAIASGTYCGVGHYRDGSNNIISDDWECGDIGGGVGASRPDLGLLLGVS